MAAKRQYKYKKKTNGKNKTGRPSREYQEEWAGMLINHMAEGLSFESFAGLIRTGKEQIYRYLEEEPDFRNARKIGDSLSMLWWEKAGIRGMNGEIKGFVSGTWIFNMKNRFGWADKQEITGKDGAPLVSEIKLTYLEPGERDT